MSRLIISDIKSLPNLQADWEFTFDNLWELLKTTPQVANNTVPLNIAERWLEVACKSLPQQEVVRQLNRKQGFGAHEVRALWAYENNEYYEQLGGIEIYADKHFRTITLPDQTEQEQLIRNFIARTLITNKFGIDRNPHNERTMATPSQDALLPWAISRPGLAGNANGKSVLIDIKSNYTNDITQSDELRLHYHALVAQSKGIETDVMYQANLNIQPEILKTFSIMMTLGHNEAESVKSAAIGMEKQGRGIELNLTAIDSSPDKFKQLVDVGQKHWANVLNGITPDFKKDIKQAFTPEQQQEYINASKEMTILSKAEKSVSKQVEKAKQKLFSVVENMNISDNVNLPYKGSTARKYTELDLANLGKQLETNLGVSPELLRKKEFNMSALERDVRGLGINVNDYATYTEFDKQKTLSMASEMGVDINSFQNKKLKLYNSGQTRGPIAAALNAVSSDVEKSLLPTLDQILQIQSANAPALYGADGRVVQNHTEINSDNQKNNAIRNNNEIGM